MEAHFVEDKDGKLDGWPIGHAYRIPQHKTLDERIEQAKQFVESFGVDIPMYVDTFDNQFNQAYAGWPDRAYLIRDGKLEYAGRVDIGGQRKRVFSDDIEEVLKNYHDANN